MAILGLGNPVSRKFYPLRRSFAAPHEAFERLFTENKQLVRIIGPHPRRAVVLLRRVKHALSKILSGKDRLRSFDACPSHTAPAQAAPEIGPFLPIDKSFFQDQT